MKYFESKQIHSCFASFSTDDARVTRPITRAEFLAHEGEKIVSHKRGFGVVYADSDKRFYDVHSFGKHANQGELGAYVWIEYLRKGWSANDSFLKEVQSAHWKDEEIAAKARRVKRGYVIPEWSKDIPANDYQGGFSADVFFNPELYDYVKSGGCHGLIGHSVRKPKLDAYLETQFLKLNPDKGLLATWLTSTGGRHFGDSLEGCSFAEQKAYIRSNIASLVAQAGKYRAQEASAA